MKQQYDKQVVLLKAESFIKLNDGQTHNMFNMDMK